MRILTNAAVVVLASLLIAGVMSANVGYAQTESSPASTVQLPEKNKFKLVVLAGQSNMAGRGFVEPEDKLPIPRVYMLDKSGQWVPAVDPVHYDKSAAGVGPGREMARLMTENDPTIAVGLVPTACGGSSVDDWQPGVFFAQTKSHPYDDAIARTKRALEDGTLEAILWRQGESDTSAEKSARHEEKLCDLFARLRKDLDAPDVPILVGELFFDKETEGTQKVRQAQLAAVEKMQPAAFISAEGTTLNPDRVHFDRKSQIEQGRRFFEALQSIKQRR